MEKLIKWFFGISYFFAAGWAIYYFYLIFIVLRNGDLMDMAILFTVITASWTIVLLIHRATLSEGDFIHSTNAKKWILSLTLPTQAYCVIIIIIAILNWLGVIPMTQFLLASLIIALTFFSLGGIPFLIGFYIYYLAPIQYYSYIVKEKNWCFGITALLIFIQVIVLFVGQYVGLFSVSL